MSLVHALGSRGFPVYFLLVRSFGTTLRIGIPLIFVILLQLQCFSCCLFFDFIFDLHAFEGGNGLFHFRLLGCRYLIGELDLEHNEKVAKSEGIFVEGHSLFLDGEDLVWLNGHALLSLDSELGAVQMVHQKINATKSLHQRNLLVHQKVSASPLKYWMLLLRHDEDNVTCLALGVLVGLSVKDVLLAIRSTFINDTLKNLRLLLRLGRIAFILRSVCFLQPVSADFDSRRFALV